MKVMTKKITKKMIRRTIPILVNLKPFKTSSKESSKKETGNRYIGMEQ
jgi:hypothetical protein